MHNQSQQHEELQYLQLCKQVIETGKHKVSRGHATFYMLGAQLRFNLENGTLPLITTKDLFVRGIIEELLWFLRGDTNSKHLEDKNVNIWKHNSSQAEVDNVNAKIMTIAKNNYHNAHSVRIHNWDENERITQEQFYEDNKLQEGECGPIYGKQFREFGIEHFDLNSKIRLFDTWNENNIPFGDQLANLLYNIRHDPNSRRHIISLWNPLALDFCVLPPCHILYHFIVDGDQISLCMTQRSGDLPLGVPFNIASCAFFLHLVAFLTGLKPLEFIHTINDAHIYDNQVEIMKEQLQREPYPFPTIQIKIDNFDIDKFYADFYRNLHDLLKGLSPANFVINNYKHHPKLQYPFST